MIEQSDLLVAIWDGASPGSIGGTRHSIESALYHGAPVIWIDAAAPGFDPHIGRSRRARKARAGTGSCRDRSVRRGDRRTRGSRIIPERAAQFQAERWHRRSRRRFHAYRRIESIFGGAGPGRFFAAWSSITRRPARSPRARPRQFLTAARSLPGTDAGFVDGLETRVFRRFAWADGLSTYLSDAYRGGMVTNFLLSAMAVIAGVAYLPLVGVDWKWPFALAELLLLLAIVGITVVGRKRRWHGRWLETRRVAEYLRHAPILLLLGVARPAARWPQGSGTPMARTLCPSGVARGGSARDRRDPGLSSRGARHSARAPCRDAARLSSAEGGEAGARCTTSSTTYREAMFILAIISVSAYLLLIAAGALRPRSRDDRRGRRQAADLPRPRLAGARRRLCRHPLSRRFRAVRGDLRDRGRETGRARRPDRHPARRTPNRSFATPRSRASPMPWTTS